MLWYNTVIPQLTLSTRLFSSKSTTFIYIHSTYHLQTPSTLTHTVPTSPLADGLSRLVPTASSWDRQPAAQLPNICVPASPLQQWHVRRYGLFVYNTPLMAQLRPLQHTIHTTQTHVMSSLTDITTVNIRHITADSKCRDNCCWHNCPATWIIKLIVRIQTYKVMPLPQHITSIVWVLQNLYHSPCYCTFATWLSHLHKSIACLSARASPPARRLSQICTVNST